MWVKASWNFLLISQVNGLRWKVKGLLQSQLDNPHAGQGRHRICGLSISRVNPFLSRSPTQHHFSQNLTLVVVHSRTSITQQWDSLPALAWKNYKPKTHHYFSKCFFHIPWQNEHTKSLQNFLRVTLENRIWSSSSRSFLCNQKLIHFRTALCSKKNVKKPKIIRLKSFTQPGF